VSRRENRLQRLVLIVDQKETGDSNLDDEREQKTRFAFKQAEKKA